ncbi:hypothetical protein CR513_05526, partial [Mucuna pruriens]
MPPQGNSPSLEDLMKQLATSNLEFQQSVSSSNMEFQQNMNATIQDLKTVSQIQQPPLTNNSESERERECSYVEKQKRTISTSTAAAEINRS